MAFMHIKERALLVDCKFCFNFHKFWVGVLVQGNLFCLHCNGFVYKLSKQKVRFRKKVYNKIAVTVYEHDMNMFLWENTFQLSNFQTTSTIKNYLQPSDSWRRTLDFCASWLQFFWMQRHVVNLSIILFIIIFERI